MATYNWKYKGGSLVKHPQESTESIAIDNSSDDVRPQNAAYVALFGNDFTGNGSRQRPYRTCEKAFLENPSIVIFGSGTYREVFIYSQNNRVLIGDGDVIFDNTHYPPGSGDWMCAFHNCQLNFRTAALRFNSIVNSIIDGFNTYEGHLYFYSYKTVFKNLKFLGFNPEKMLHYRLGTEGNNTFVNVEFNSLEAGVYGNKPVPTLCSSIFKNCKFTLKANEPFGIMYSLFFNCIFKYSFDTSYTAITTTQELRDFIARAPLYLSNMWDSNQVADPKFNNESAGDYCLAMDSPAKNLSYVGSYVGARSIANTTKILASATDSALIHSSAINLNIVNNSLTIIDDDLEGSVESKIIYNPTMRELGKAMVYGNHADRNGQYVDSVIDLATFIVAAGTNGLNTITPYVVENGAITYNGNIYQAGERFTTTSIKDFTTSAGGICREILEAPQRHTIMARFFNGGVSKTAGNALVSGYWYYVTGSITYNSVIYTDTFFKATGTAGFTGQGVAIEAMTNQTFQHYEIGEKITTNNVGDARIGEIVRGNGDMQFDRSPSKVFSVNAKFIQFKFILLPFNLKP